MAAGEITTTSLLDREAKSEYILIVRAVDGGVGHHQKTGIAMVSVGAIPISCCPPGAGIVESCSVSFLLCEEPTVVPALCTTPAAAPKIIVQVVQTLKSACFPGKPFTQEPPGFPEPVGVAVSPTPPAERSLCSSWEGVYSESLQYMWLFLRIFPFCLGQGLPCLCSWEGSGGAALCFALPISGLREPHCCQSRKEISGDEKPRIHP